MKLLHCFTGCLFVIALVSCAAPKAAFDVRPEERTAPADVTFENHSENAETYFWEFGDGNTSQDSAATHRYRRSGEYTVTLRAVAGKRIDETQKTIMVKSPDQCLVEIETPHGNMLVELYDETPLHRDNFLKLVEDNFYDGLIFHRVIDGFMIQGGDPNSKDASPGASLGSGGPGYQVQAEFSPNLIHLKGALAAARTGDAVNPERKSSGSQFYIVQGNPVQESMLDMVEVRNGIQYSPEQKEAYAEMGGTPQLDMQYTVFGRVVEGLEVIDRIASVQTDRRDRPEEDITMKMFLVK